MKPLCLLLLTVVSACGLPPKEVTASQVSTAISKHGGKAVVNELNHAGGLLSLPYLTDKVASGNSSWLKIASALRPYTDAGNSEALDNAVAAALLKSPEQVLGMLGPFKTDRICSGAQFIEVPTGTVEEYLQRAQMAVKRVQTPALANNKKSCLAELEASARAMSTKH